MTSHIVTGKSLGSLVQISKGYDSYLDERGRGKAKKLVNIAIYRIFDRMCVSFGVAIIRDCMILLIYFAGRVAGSPSISPDRQGHQNLNLFFSNIGRV